MLFWRALLATWIGLNFVAQGQELGRPPEAPTAERLKEMKKAEPPLAEFGSGFVVNTQNREEARNFYRAVYSASTNVAMGWNGNLTNCTPGTTDGLFKEQVRLRINFFRAMAGVPSAIEFNPEFSRKDQEAALMMAANNALTHTPPGTWKCYTTDGATAAGSSNLALGYSGPTAIDAYMDDPGDGNYMVGHRRWLLYPQTKFMGTGDIPLTAGREINGVWVIDANFGTKRPATREPFVAWPPPGYVPWQVLASRWSLAFTNANFSAAVITMSSNGVSVPITKENVFDGYGENTVVWYPSSMFTFIHFDWPKPAADATYAINISGVTGPGVPSSFSYQVKVFDPATAGPDTIVPTISGPDTIPNVGTTSFSFAKLPLATGYEGRVRERVALGLDGGDNGLGNFLVSTSGNYNVVITAPVAAGSKGFRLAHFGSRLQSLTIASDLFVRPGAKLNFASKMGIGSVNEFARVRVSTDGGATFNEIFSKQGNGSTVVDPAFVNVSLALDAYVGKAIQVKFAFESGGGGVFNTAAADFGWYFDEISWVNVDQLKNPAPFAAGNGTFNFGALTPGGYALEVRPQMYNEFFLEWGPIKAVTAILDLAPRLEFQPNVGLGESTLIMDFTASNMAVGALWQLFKAPTVDGPWTVETEAVFETISANVGRVTLPRNSAPTTVYRLKAQ